MERLLAVWNYVKRALAWLWSTAPQWLRYVLMLVLGIVLSLLAQCAFATDKPKDPAPNAEATAGAEADAVAKASAGSMSKSEASSGGNTLSVEEGGSYTTVLVPNNNTEKCLRVFGFAFGSDDGSAMFGIPFRSTQCDLEAAADDAFAQGNITLGWMFKCKMKSLQKAFGNEQACLDATSDAVARQAEMSRLRESVLSLQASNHRLTVENAQRFTPAQADERCERKTRSGICATGK